MMESNSPILLSFVLPIYNVEKYIEECVDSILSQMTDDCEIILVDDGATDSSGQICDEYAARDFRIRVVHKENGGLSSARNAGLSLAKGKYVTFVDSDDKIFPETVSKILRWIQTEEADICFLQLVKVYPDGIMVNMGEEIVRTQLCRKVKEEAIRHLASRPKYPGSSCGKLYRRRFLIDNDLHFPLDSRCAEDLGFVRDCILYAQSMDALEIPFYQYRQNRPGSITHRATSKNFFGALLFISESVEKLTVNKKPKDLICRHALSFVAYEYAILLYLYNYIDSAEKKDALKQLKAFKWTLKYAESTKWRLVSFVCRIMGIRATSFLLHLYRKAGNQ